MPIRCITAALVQEIIRSYGHVRKLNLSSNAIERVEELDALTSLTKLNLADNQLTSNPGCLEGLLRLTALEELDLSCNEIRQLDVFSHHVRQQQQQQPAACLSLHSLNLADNRISDMAQIVHLQQLSCLTKLQLTGNPLCNVMHYRAKVKALLPRLLVLDDGPLSDDRGYSSSNSDDDSSSNSSDHSSSSTCNSRNNCSDIAEDVADAGSYRADSLPIDHQVSVAAAVELTELAIADATVSTAIPAVAAFTQSTPAAAVIDECCTDEVLAGLAILSPGGTESASAESTRITAAVPTVAAAEPDAVDANATVAQQADDADVSVDDTLQQQLEQQQSQQHAVDSGRANALDDVLSDTDHSRTDTVAVTLDDDSETSNVHINDSTNASAAASSHAVVAAAAADNSSNAAALGSSADTVAITDGGNSSQLNSQTASSDTVAQTAIPPGIDSIHERVPSTAECTAAAAASDTASPIPLVTTTAAHKVDAIAEQLQHGMDAPPAVLQTATSSIDDAGSSIDTTQLQHNASNRPTMQQPQQRSHDDSAQQAVSELHNVAAAAVIPAVPESASSSNINDSSMSSNTAQQPASTATVPVMQGSLSSSDADVIASLKREVALLTVQNAAMKRAALMADTAITASSAHVNATQQQQQQQQQQQHTVSRIRRRPWEATTDNNSINTSDKDSDTVNGSNIDSRGGQQQQQQHDETTTDDDKYVKLLNHWRHEVVRLLIQQASQQVCQ
jgi:Leucine Rich repeats (2 copies)